MKPPKKSLKKGSYSAQPFIVRFRASNILYERLRKLSLEEEMCLAGFIRKLVETALQRFPD